MAYLRLNRYISIKVSLKFTGQQNFDQNVTGQWAYVSGLIFQADFESESHFSVSGLVLLT